MTLIRRSSPFGELVSLRQAMDRLFEDSYVRPRGGSNPEENPLALDVYTTQDALVIEAALPGVKPEDVDISVLGDTLTINASTRDEESRNEGGYSYREIRRGSFTRQVTLPGGLKADAATADFENGILRLSFPKAEEAKPRQIQIKTGAGAQGSGSAGARSGSQGGSDDGSTGGQSGRTDVGQQSTEAANAQPVNQWQSTGDANAWQSTGESNQWQPHGQSQTNEQPRVEQGS